YMLIRDLHSFPTRRSSDLKNKCFFIFIKKVFDVFLKKFRQRYAIFNHFKQLIFNSHLRIYPSHLLIYPKLFTVLPPLFTHMFLQNKNRLYVCNRIEQKSCPDSTIKNFLNSETMKKVFLSATALGLFFMSCSNDDIMAESANSTKDVQTLAYMARQQTDLTTVINEVQNKCRGINGQGTALITAVEETAMQISSFEALVDENYKTPTIDELNTPVGIAQMS